MTCDGIGMCRLTLSKPLKTLEKRYLGVRVEGMVPERIPGRQNRDRMIGVMFWTTKCAGER